MNAWPRLFAVALSAVFSVGLAAQASASASLLERTAVVLGEHFYDRAFCRDRLPELLARYRPAAAAAATPGEERAVVHAFLGEVPASHLALLSKTTQRHMLDELSGRKRPTLGFGLLAFRGRWFADSVLDDGPAAHAGLLTGEEVVAIDAVEPGSSERLDWRNDDAALPDLPTHELLVAADDRVAITVRGRDGARREIVVTAAPWSALESSRRSVREIEVEGVRIVYVHLWYVFDGRAARLVVDARRDHEACRGLLLDLRGRGGSALECTAIVRAVADAAEEGVPTVALVDRRTRSAKEVVASELKRRGVAQLVGEHTAGAVLPASFEDVDDDAILMLPEMQLGAHSKRLEGHGVEPDLAVASPLPRVPGEDPILAAGIAALRARIAATVR